MSVGTAGNGAAWNLTSNNQWWHGGIVWPQRNIITFLKQVSALPYTYHKSGCRQHVPERRMQCRSSTCQRRATNPRCWWVVLHWHGFIFREIQQPTKTSKLDRMSAVNTCLTFPHCTIAGLFPNHPFVGKAFYALETTGVFKSCFYSFFFFNKPVVLGWADSLQLTDISGDQWLYEKISGWPTIHT